MPVGTLLPTPLGESDQQEHWVDYVFGDDANDGLSIGLPKKTISSVWASLGTVTSDIIYLRNSGLHVLSASTLLFPTTKFGISRSRPITMMTWPDDMNPLGLPGTRGEAVISGGGLVFQPGSLRAQNYNGGAGFNFKLQNFTFQDFPGATTSSGQGTAVSALRTDNVIGFEARGIYANRPSFCGALIRGAGRTTTLSSGISATATSFNVASMVDFLTPTPFYAVIGGGDGTEIVLVNTVSGNTWSNVDRGQRGTPATAFTAGATIENYLRGGDTHLINWVVEDPSDGTAWAVAHSHGVYWGSDNGFDGVNYPKSSIQNFLAFVQDPARGGAYGINCYEQGDESIVTNFTVDGLRRGGITISGQDVHATDNAKFKNGIITNISTNNPGPGYAVDSFMTGNFGPGSGNVVDKIIWANALTFHRTGADAVGITFGSALNLDPRYVDRVGKNYSILDDSPAINFVEVEYVPPFDIKGSLVNETNASAGAFAVVAGSPPAQTARPASTISAGSWLTHTGGTDLHTALRETVPDDNTYIQGPLSPVSPSVARVRLEPMTDPVSNTGHIISYRWLKNAAAGDRIDLTVRLYDTNGTTLIAEWIHTNIGTVTQANQGLTAGQADSITDYSGLVIEFVETKV